MVGAPTAAQQGDYLVQFEGGGHTGQAYNWPTAAISLVAAENWTPTAQGTRMLFGAAPIGGDSATTRIGSKPMVSSASLANSVRMTSSTSVAIFASAPAARAAA